MGGESSAEDELDELKNEKHLYLSNIFLFNIPQLSLSSRFRVFFQTQKSLRL